MSISSHLYREKRDELTLGPLGGKTVVWHLSYFKKKGWLERMGEPRKVVTGGVFCGPRMESEVFHTQGNRFCARSIHGALEKVS